MPTFSAIALERLLEPSGRDSSRNTSLRLKQETNKNQSQNNSNEDDSGAKKPPNHIYITPALYTTPEPMPIPETSLESVSPSPYVVNRKRRDVRVPEAVNRLDGFEIQQKPEEEAVLALGRDSGNGDNNLVNSMVVACADNSFAEVQEDNEALRDVEIVEGKGELVEEDALEKDERSDDFFGPCDSMSVTSVASCKNTSVANQSEFYDADEEFFSDGCISNASPSLSPNIEVELHSARLKLSEEIEKRKKADDALAQMRNQWLKISRQLSQVGLSFPSTWDARNHMQLGEDSVEQLCQEVVVARFVSEAIGRAHAFAETEAVAEAVIESKNQEISRLRDRLQYYETVNQEMSNRNQEVIEIARRQRQRRMTQQKWLWRCLGLSVTLGASVLAYSYLSHADKHPVENSSDFSNTSSGTPKSG